ncbi:MAG: transcriptional regulator [Clostridiales bacterium]|nr:transcriptional regulator [Clostridiales bacterium]
MVFSSLTFLFAFLPITILLYFIAPRNLRNLVLLVTSLVFYAWGEPIYLFLMIFTTVFDFLCGLLIEKYRNNRGVAKCIFIISVIVNLGILGFFKYYKFIVFNINSITGLNIPIIDLPLPVGISFYTFQTMSYVIDVYLNKVKVQRNIVSFGTYVTMFPQLIAGPIVKYGDIAEQLGERKESMGLFGEGVEIFIRGLGKKVLLANDIGILWTAVKATPFQELTVLTAWLGIIGFTFQIYFDFSGYSDMAIGLGKMFGFDIMKNFDYPYISKSITEFWRRWHISLSDWFREYVYIPLGGNRKGRLNQYRNLIIVWLLTGLWHGANWNFILWGLYFGLFLIIEKLFLLKWLENKPNVIKHIYTLLIVIIGWVLFEFENLSKCFGYLKAMFGIGGQGLYNGQAIYYLYTNAIIFIILIICSTPITLKFIEWVKVRFKLVGNTVVPLLYFIIMLLSTAYLVNESYNPFLYFRF